MIKYKTPAIPALSRGDALAICLIMSTVVKPFAHTDPHATGYLEWPLRGRDLLGPDDGYWPFRDQTESLELRTPMYPYVALCCPTYRENSHANRTWRQHSHETARLVIPGAPSPWVRFPSPAPLFAVWRVPALC
jgi:hypothetical protein